MPNLQLAKEIRMHLHRERAPGVAPTTAHRWWHRWAGVGAAARRRRELSVRPLEPTGR